MSAEEAVRSREARLRERNRPPPTRPELAAMTKADLVALAAARGVDASGTKADIIDRLAR